MSQVRHPQEILDASTALKSGVSISTIAKAFAELVTDSGTVIADMAKAALTDTWSSSDQQNLINLLDSPGYKTLEPLISSFESVAFVVGGDGGFIVAGKGVGGVIFEPANPAAPQYYFSLGVTVGGTEGATAVTGLVLNKEDIHHAGGFEAYLSAQVDVGVGVAGETFHDLFGSNDGFVVLVTSGEELDLSAGVGYTKIKGFKS